MMQQYLDRILEDKNKGIYFKKGRWFMQLLFWTIILFSYLFEYYNLKTGHAITLITIGITFQCIPYLLFFLFYSDELIPKYFKKNSFKLFWKKMILYGILLPLASTILQWGILKLGFSFWTFSISFWELLWFSYKQFFTCFLTLTSILYLMENLENIGTTKSLNYNQSLLQKSELEILKTSTNPNFILQSLSGLKRLSYQNNKTTPHAIILFSDLLRYKLYQSGVEYINIDKEVEQINNLIELHNHICPLFPAQMDVRLENENATIIPNILVNFISAVFNPLQALDKSSNVYVFLLIDSREIQVVLEIEQLNNVKSILEVIQHQEQFIQHINPQEISCETEINDNNLSIQLCLTLPHNNSTV